MAGDGWAIASTGDLDGSATADILWRHRDTGANAAWMLEGLSVVGQGTLPAVPDTGWSVAATGDFDGDGDDDALWRHE